MDARLAIIFPKRDRALISRNAGGRLEITKLPQLVVISPTLLEKFGTLIAGHLPPSHLVPKLKPHKSHGVFRRVSGRSDD